MSNPSITEMVRNHFAKTTPQKIAEQWSQWKCGNYAHAGDAFDEMQEHIIQFELPLAGAMPLFKFKAFCDHVAKQAGVFFEQAQIPVNAVQVPHVYTCAHQEAVRSMEILHNRTELALAV